MLLSNSCRVRLRSFTFSRLSAFPRVAAQVRVYNKLTSRDVLAAFYQVQHPLLHLDVPTVFASLLFLTEPHCVVEGFSEELRIESVDNLHRESLTREKRWWNGSGPVTYTQQEDPTEGTFVLFMRVGQVLFDPIVLERLQVYLVAVELHEPW